MPVTKVYKIWCCDKCQAHCRIPSVDQPQGKFMKACPKPPEFKQTGTVDIQTF